MSKQKAYGRRAVNELLETELKIDEILVLSAGKGAELDKIIRLAEKRNIRIGKISRNDIDRICPDVNHQGIVAYYQTPRLISLDEILSEKTDGSELIVILDGVEDPHNLGAIIRTTEVFGGRCVVIRSRRAVGLKPSTIKASAGSALRFLVVEVSNIEQTIRLLKDKGYWIFGLDPDGKSNIWDTDLSGNTALVFGSEGKGLSQLVKKRCDALISIPQKGKIASLNVSVSAGVTLAEWLRQTR